MSVTLLTGFLSACAEDNPGELHKQPGETITAAQDSAKPSFSAAQLANDASGSVQSAMAVAAGEDPITIPGIAEALVVASESDSSSVDGSTSETISGSTPQTEAEPELQ
ncbi:MAG: hypothetical protein KTR32_08935, partial [Granulosicoccus sp.]|nr:hypothetical protein [Granulosicoccus sp.]